MALARHNLLVVTLDSLRYDTCLAADPQRMGRLGTIERRYSYASWTAPAHYNLLMGLLPHRSPQQVYASDYYKQDFRRYSERLGAPDIDFSKLLPSLWLPTYLRTQLGYCTHAMVSMPVLNPATPINRDFDSYQLMTRHNDLAAMVDALRFDDQPAFYLLNSGETHYPYAVPGEDPSEWPRIPGVHGAAKDLDAATTTQPDFFDSDQLERLRNRQVVAMRYVDELIERIYDAVPSNTWIVITSDHGELFGEDGYFGHGPINHEKVLEVPFVEGLRP